MRASLLRGLGRTVLLAVAVLLLPAGCDDGAPGCRAACEDNKADLEGNFGCTVDCSAPPWSDAKSCDECMGAFETTCHVKLVDSCFCHEYLGDACLE